jgi:uncharacterized membrane protein HdeD (DUF308 family)
VRAQERHQPRWWALVLQEIAGVIAGVLLYIVAFWSIVTGVLEIAAAIRLRRELRNEWLLILSGTASALLGILLVAAPGAGLLAWAWVIGAYALASGVLLLMLALRLRGHGRDDRIIAQM